METAPQSPGTGNGVKLALGWGFVSIPLVWGIVQTLVNAIRRLVSRIAACSLD
ncbi:MAG: hypothetical protein WCB44_05105 [Stellaceae bacterium]